MAASFPRSYTAHSRHPFFVSVLIWSWISLLFQGTFVVADTINANNDEWQLLWSEEFDGDSLDDTFWNIRTGFLGFNSEFQTYTDHPENIRVQDGKLHISAVRDSSAQVGYTSGRVNTMDKMQLKFATVETSIKIPDMKLGLWPAFWTLGQDYPQVGWPKAGELDIMELGQKQGGAAGLGNHRVISALHWDAMGQYVYEDAILDVPYDLSQGFHTYKMEWQPDYVAMYIDGRQIGRFSIGSCFTLWDCPELHQFHFLVLNVAVAGQFTCCEYGFEPNAFPNGTAWTMEVDYVRVYGNEHTEVILPDGVTIQTRAPSPAPSPNPTKKPTTYITLSPVASSRPLTSPPTKATTSTTSPTSIAPTALPSSIGTTTLSPTLPLVTGTPTSAPIISTQVPTTMTTTSTSTAGTTVEMTTAAPTDPTTNDGSSSQQVVTAAPTETITISGSPSPQVGTAAPTEPTTNDGSSSPQVGTASPIDPTTNGGSPSPQVILTSQPTASSTATSNTVSKTQPTEDMLADLILQDDYDTFTTAAPMVTSAPSALGGTSVTSSPTAESTSQPTTQSTSTSLRTGDEDATTTTTTDEEDKVSNSNDGVDTTTSQIQSSGFSWSSFQSWIWVVIAVAALAEGSFHLY
ncbi:Beta-glucan synthesis-associated protein (SKN1) [Seminavis robusta]|uniref:Beta-glucan synthesis-associated protein (SKN1) n=1 Tax=Seminavis robusta TaxID=568900 RepID=A0A9N8DNI2_9STRA|nr:Beta-glucan synthesis-associated protein (SKN1) [Seminavis robusta]|eukprot:Sro177_g077900.1 Beta-glucan synthesis-associated protein (SKN1) (631) ;mRNA; r:82750-84642